MKSKFFRKCYLTEDLTNFRMVGGIWNFATRQSARFLLDFGSGLGQSVSLGICKTVRGTPFSEHDLDWDRMA